MIAIYIKKKERANFFKYGGEESIVTYDCNVYERKARSPTHTHTRTKRWIWFLPFKFSNIIIPILLNYHYFIIYHVRITVVLPSL